MKILPMESGLFYADEVNSRFPQFRQRAIRNTFIVYQAANLAMTIGNYEYPTEG
jgi:hypothetical protein